MACGHTRQQRASQGNWYRPKEHPEWQQLVKGSHAPHLRNMAYPQICRLQLQRAIFISPSRSDSISHLGLCSNLCWSWEQSPAYRPQSRFGPLPSQPSVPSLKEWSAFFQFLPSPQRAARTLASRQSLFFSTFMVFNMSAPHLSRDFEVLLWHYHNHRRQMGKGFRAQ